MATKLYVGNLSFNTTEADLRAHFSQAGSVVKAELVTDKFTSKSRGFAFVEMGTQEEAEKAIQALNGTQHEGRSLTVNLSKPREDRPSRGGGGGGGYRDRY